MKKLEMTYAERARLAKNPAAKKLFELMDSKKTNLILANDEHDPEKFLEHCDTLGPELAVMKTHIDILDNFTPAIINRLVELSKKHNFMIFEDRKFADIGNTVRLQYSHGVYRIADWADFVNLHIVPGPGVIDALQGVAEEKKDGKARGFLILAQMSSKGSMAVGEYTKKAIEMANENKESIAGFIGTGSSPETLKELSYVSDPGHVILTPGVKIVGDRDTLGQRYTHPREAILAGSDAIVVGRGIYQAEDPITEVKKYRDAAWNAYLQRTGKKSPAERVAEILLDIKAVTLRPKEPFRFVSGVLSPIYTDCRLLISHPREFKEITQLYADKIRELGILNKITNVAGTATAGIPYSTLLARELGLPSIYVRSSEKEHGKQKKVEGVLKKDDYVIVIEDLFSSGGSSINTIKTIQDEGAAVEHCISIFTYNFPKVKKNFSIVNVQNHSLCDMNTLVNVARRRGIIDDKDVENVKGWVKDPEIWKG